MYQGQAE